MIRTLLDAAMLTAVLATGIAAPASAQVRRQEYVIVWYTDESYSTISGQRIKFCDGGTFRSGTPTFFEEETYYGCD